MGGFVVFIIVLIAIWTLSAIATAVNKQKDLDRRRRLQAELQRAAVQRASGQPPRRISEGIATRYPDVLLPPAPPPMRRQAPPQVVPGRRPPAAQRRPVQQRRAVQPAARAPAAAIIAPAPPPPSPVASPITSPTKARVVPTVDAPAIRKWAKPATLRQQFMLTEIFQPPLALREERQ